ncbi:hypothetical protein [Comamonas jiangduensis]|uniref:hypothetical protein n=1 Tax=Comamonas jiangduensis TaxID=1194168 RepID=UPI0024E10FB5|nr:hypothetical protein [Comamonas jiangduensis]
MAESSKNKAAPALFYEAVAAEYASPAKPQLMVLDTIQNANKRLTGKHCVLSNL